MNLSYRIQRKTKKIFREYLFKKEFVKKTKYDFKILLDVSRDVDKHFYWGEFEINLIKFLQLLLPKSKNFIDVGANIGIYTLLSSRYLEKGGRVYAFEPSDWAYNRLLTNVTLNNVTNVEIIKKAVSNKSGRTKLFICEDDAYNSLYSKPMRTVKNIVEVDTISIDDHCINNNINTIDIIKIDAEGADFLVLKGAENILKSDNPPVIIFEFNRKISEDISYSMYDFVEFMKELSYNFFTLIGQNLIKIDMLNTEAIDIICLKNYHIVKYDLIVKL